MNRRDFLKGLVTPVLAFSGLGFLGLSGKRAFGYDLEEDTRALKIWTYYVPLTSYNGILETAPGMNPLDRKVIYSELIKKTGRINGKESDGTKNNASFEISDLEKANESIRIRFWHDDNGRPAPSGHTLYVFKRYLEDLSQGKKVFVATGMYQGHFHVVMIQPPSWEE